MDQRRLYWQCPNCSKVYSALDSEGNVVGAAAGTPCPHMIVLGADVLAGR